MDRVFADRLRGVRVVPVVTVADAHGAVDLVGTLAAAGLDVVEITLRTPAALSALAAAAAAGPWLVGAGTVTSRDQARAALDAGARFLVSPGLDDEVIAVAASAGVPVLPGVATATEIMRARSLGLAAVKIFPVEQLGGVGVVRAMSAVFPGLGLVPTGGVTAASAPGYLGVPAVLAVGGTWITPPALLAARDWSAVAALARAAASLRPAATVA